MSDLKSRISVVKTIAPISPAATGAITGTAVDLAGYRSATVVISAGAQTTTGITVTPVVVSGSATGSMTAVADADLIGTEAAAALDGTAGAATTTTIGYIGTDRYIGCNLTVVAAATGVYSAQVVREGMKNPQ